MKLMNTNVWILEIFNYNEKFTILKFWLIFPILERGGFVVQLIAAKVIRQHAYGFLYIILFLR